MTRSLLALPVLAGVAAVVPTGTRAQAPVPTDPKQTCVVAPATFKQWFGGNVTKNGMVNPANSVGFTVDQTNPHCSFYQWSEQMFLWLTSPLGGPGQYVFNSPMFYNVDPSSGTVTPNTPPAPGGPPPALKLNIRGDKPSAKGKRLLTTRSGAVIQDETGQAGGGGSLISQNGALVYYSTHVNDVFAAFRTGVTANAFNPAITTFPTNLNQLKQIVAFAQTIGLNLPDALALTMEVKISWVDASTVPAGQFVTVQATIPTYDFTQPAAPIPGSSPSATGWVPTGVKTTTMAMVGIHVVGSVQGHPEMIWATFEHATNCPDGPYQYTNAAGGTTTVPFNPAPPAGSTWLFSGNTSPFNPNPAAYNLEALKTISLQPSGTAIAQQPGASAGLRSLTMRSFPWGVKPGDPQGIADATQIISINNSVRGQLAAGDTRGNYVMIGAVWTGGGVPPQQPATVPANAMPIGSVLLANCTMETYKQTIATSLPFGTNCFSCHDGDPLNGLSHIWSNMDSLPAARKK